MLIVVTGNNITIYEYSKVVVDQNFYFVLTYVNCECILTMSVYCTTGLNISYITPFYSEKFHLTRYSRGGRYGLIKKNMILEFSHASTKIVSGYLLLADENPRYTKVIAHTTKHFKDHFHQCARTERFQ